MMKKILLFLSVVCGALSLNAAQISETEAMNIAKQWANSSSTVRVKSLNSTKAPLSLAYKSLNQVSGATDFYVFNRGNQHGYILVSGSDATASVLGYADNGSFNYDELPDNFKNWLEGYAQEIEFASRNANSVSQAPSITPFTTSVAPLLGETKWNQSTPYNALCPTFSGTTKCVTGCVATAMAQIMYSHQWPATGTGSISYKFKLGSDSIPVNRDFSQSTYAWDKMTPTYDAASTSDSKNAVAQLMFDCGASVKSRYGSSTAAGVSEPGKAWRTYFDYNTDMAYRSRNYYSGTDWEAIIKAELDRSQSVFYTANSTNGNGHAFVIDGYNADGYFHVNWGWGGGANGYFLTTALTSSWQGIGGGDGGFINGHAMITGIRPSNKEGEDYNFAVTSETGLVPQVESVQLGKQAKFSAQKIYNRSYQSQNILFYTVLFDEEGNVAGSYNPGTFYTAKDNGYGWSSANYYFTPAANLANGNYKLYWYYYQSADKVKLSAFDLSKLTPIRIRTTESQYVDVEVRDGYAYFSNNNNYPELSYTSIEPSCELYSGREFAATATIENVGSEYYDFVYLGLFPDQDFVIADDSLAVSTARKIDIENGKPVRVEFSMNADVAKGTYRLAILDSSKELVLEGTPVKVTVGAAINDPQLTITSQITPKSSSMDAGNIEATAKIKNTDGYFASTIQAVVLDTDKSSVLGNLSKYAVISSNEEKEIAFSGNMSSGTVGSTYYVALKDPFTGKIWGNMAPFTLSSNSSAVNNVGDAKASIYPNPARDIVNITNSTPIKHICIYSLLGALVSETAVSSEYSTTVDVSALPSGHYVVKVIGENTINVSSLIKK